MQSVLRAVFFVAVFALAGPVILADDCVDCHRKETRNIVNDGR